MITHSQDGYNWRERYGGNKMRKIRIVYKAEDGKEFDSKEEAEAHQEKLSGKDKVKDLKKVLPAIHELHLDMICKERKKVIEILSRGDLIVLRDLSRSENGNCVLCKDCVNENECWDYSPCNKCKVNVGVPTEYEKKEE